jgi:hypothetical protein
LSLFHATLQKFGLKRDSQALPGNALFLIRDAEGIAPAGRLPAAKTQWHETPFRLQYPRRNAKLWT